MGQTHLFDGLLADIRTAVGSIEIPVGLPRQRRDAMRVPAPCVAGVTQAQPNQLYDQQRMAGNKVTPVHEADTAVPGAVPEERLFFLAKAS